VLIASAKVIFITISPNAKSDPSILIVLSSKVAVTSEVSASTLLIVVGVDVLSVFPSSTLTEKNAHGYQYFL
jgi:hypothetical protein